MRLRGAHVAAIGVALAAFTALLYLPTLQFDFIRYDDPSYVWLHPRIARGLSADNVRWSLTAFEVGNWHPLTLISHMLDVSLFGLRPGAHHMVNAGLHAANVALLFTLVAAASRRPWSAATAAMLFAIHPLNVESVAWISQRKSVLAMALLLFAMNIYVDWVRRRGIVRYLAALTMFGAALAAKPMVVIAPGLLLVLDVWPLGRLRGEGAADRVRGAGKLIVEKLPWMGLAAASAIVTLLAQRAGGAMSEAGDHPAAESLAHTLFAYGWYPFRMVWPVDLSLFYPMSLGASASRMVAGAALVLTLIGVAAVATRHRAPYVAFGVAWYVIALLPVAGFVRFGTQIVADRYAYLSLIGPFIAIGCAVEDLWSGSRIRVQRAMIVIAAAATIALVVGQQIALARWRDSETILTAGVRRAPDNPHALTNLGFLLIAEERLGEGIALLERAQKIVPRFRPIHVKLGYAYARTGQLAAARAQYDEALRLDGNDPAVLLDLAGVLAALGDNTGSEARRREAAALAP